MSKFKKLFCLYFGHSKIVNTCFGYINCGRCEDQIGDALGGIFDLGTYVIIGHKCKKCKKNYEKLNWKDKLLVGDPFKK